MIDCHRRGAIERVSNGRDFVQLCDECDAEQLLDIAFDAAELCDVARLLDAEDIVCMRVPDKLSIITYLSEIYKVFSGARKSYCL